MARRGRRGEGSVYYSKSDRRWVAKYPLGVVDGKRQAKRVKCRTRDDADAELERMVRAYGRGATPAGGTLDQYLADWLPSHARSIRQSTADSYRTHIRLWIGPLLGGIPVAKLRPADVRRLITDMERKGKSPGYIHLVVRTLSSALGAGVAERTLQDNATVGVRLPRIDREPVHALTADERDAILDAVKGHWVEGPVRVWLGSGLRRGEVLGLDQGDLELDAGFVRVRISKTRVRAVPITGDAADALADALRAAKRRGPREPVFTGHRSHDRMRGDSITHALPKLLEAAGLGRITPHVLRHGAATLMLSGGASMRAISEQLGHRNPSLTARVYAHVIPEAQRSALGSLERRQAR
jgi:integrase